MDYLIILLAAICYAGQFAFTKVYEGAVKQTFRTSLIMLIVSNIVGVMICLCFCGFRVQFSDVSVFWAVILALVMIPYCTIGIKVLSMGSLAIYSMFMMLGGMLLPFFYGILFLQEAVTIGKVLGTILLTVFIVLQALAQQKSAADNEKAGGKTNILFFVLCMAVFVLNGTTAIIAKTHQLSEGAVDEGSFTVFSCALTAIFSAVLFVASSVKSRRETCMEAVQTLKLKPICATALIGVGAYGGNFLLLMAASNVPASIQFPLISGGVIVLSALTSAFIFREKLSRMEWLTIAGAFLSTVLFAF